MRAVLAVIALVFALGGCALTDPSRVAGQNVARPTQTQPQQGPAGQTFSEDEIVAAAGSFFGAGAEGLAEVTARVFRENGRPVGYIAGEEASGAFGVGLRYGEGTLRLRSGETRTVYWQGPSVGFDVGGDASKVFTLVYGLSRTDDIYQRFPGVNGSAYFVGGIAVNYQQAGSIVLAPMRTGVGFRLGANVGYLAYTRERQVLPF